jgi:uncharacterized membrane protein YcaP (DUF421 family)
MIYLLAIVVLALVAIVGSQIYSVIKADQNKIDELLEGEPLVMDDKIDYSGYKLEVEDWNSTSTTEEPITYIFAGTTETTNVEVKEEKPKKKKSYYKKKDKKNTGEKTAPKMKDKGTKKKGGKDDLLLS